MIMWELYLISRCDAILTVFIVVAGLAVFALGVSVIDYATNGKGELNSKGLKYSPIILSIFGTLAILTPSKEDALLIFGLGSTINYIQSNEKVQQLPDKCVDALEAWVESLSEERR